MPFVIANPVLGSKVPQAVALLAENNMTELISLPAGYAELLEEIVDRVARSQTRAALGVSRELVLLYWSVGAEILLRQQTQGWGAKVIDRLGRDLQARFPGVEGFSPRNLKYMRSLAEAWPDPEIVPQRVALLPWGHLRLLLDRVGKPNSFGDLLDGFGAELESTVAVLPVIL